MIQLSPAWDPEGGNLLVCRPVLVETDDIQTFAFDGDKPNLFFSETGQFLTLLSTIGGENISYFYTIASPPAGPNRVSVTVKRQPSGRISNRLRDAPHPGIRMRTPGPAGNFTTNPPRNPKLLLS